MKTNTWTWNLFNMNLYLYYPVAGGTHVLCLLEKLFISFYKVSSQASVSSCRTWLILIEMFFFFPSVLPCFFLRWAEKQKLVLTSINLTLEEGCFYQKWKKEMPKGFQKLTLLFCSGETSGVVYWTLSAASCSGRVKLQCLPEICTPALVCTGSTAECLLTSLGNFLILKVTVNSTLRSSRRGSS